MFHTSRKYKTGLISLTYLVVVALCILLAGCDINISGPGIGTGSSGSGCQGNCTTGAGVQGVQVAALHPSDVAELLPQGAQADGGPEHQVVLR